MTRALKLQQKAATVGFDWGEAAPILDKIEEEIGELRAAMASNRQAEIADEFGDLLFAIVNFGRHLGVDPEAALAGTNEKFRSRFSLRRADAARNRRNRWILRRQPRRDGSALAANGKGQVAK